VNGDLEGNPQLVNSDPYGEGWLLDLQVEAGTLEEGLRGLLDADGYRATATE
jgi:glycine cleavage system H protein